MFGWKRKSCKDCKNWERQVSRTKDMAAYRYLELKRLQKVEKEFDEVEAAMGRRIVSLRVDLAELRARYDV